MTAQLCADFPLERFANGQVRARQIIRHATYKHQTYVDATYGKVTFSEQEIRWAEPSLIRVSWKISGDVKDSVFEERVRVYFIQEGHLDLDITWQQWIDFCRSAPRD